MDNKIQLATSELRYERNKQLTVNESEGLNLEISKEYTIVFWMKFSKPHTGAIVAKMDNNGHEFFKGWNVLLRNENNIPTIVFQLINEYPKNLIEVICEINNFEAKKWYHITISYNGLKKDSSVNMFIDGNPVRTITKFNSLTSEINNNLPITIGSRTNGLGFRGNIYDLCLYNTELTNKQICEKYKETKTEILKNESEILNVQNEKKILIKLEKISRSFKIYHERPMDIFSKIKSVISRERNAETLMVLDNISFELREGEMLGIVGSNGSGKTTLLKIIGGILNPSSGKIAVNGKMSSFLSLGSGFNPDLTARDNVILYGMILGEQKKVMEEKVDSVIKFAELENFENVKIKKFSTGMNMRLAFSTAMCVNPDILLVDEVLSVGDYSFQQKSLDAFLKIKNSGKGIVFVSHNLEQLESFCDRIIVLEKGKIVHSGEPDDMIAEYKKLMKT